jgi:hypothetical protein
MARNRDNDKTANWAGGRKILFAPIRPKREFPHQTRATAPPLCYGGVLIL